MVLAYRAIIAIVQLVFYVPGFSLSILLASRHGFAKSAGWYFLIAFTLVRTVGAICEIISIQSFSVGVFIAALICSSIGLAPLTLLCLSMLSRVNSHTTRPIPKITFRWISLLSFLGLILAIVGGSLQEGRTSTTLTAVRPEIKASILIFVAVYLSTVACFSILSMRASTVSAGERRLLVAVALSIPFIAVRLIYSLIADFAGLQSFSLAFGDTTIYLCMNVIMEIIVTIIVIVFGLTLQVLPKEAALESESALEEAEVNTNSGEKDPNI